MKTYKKAKTVLNLRSFLASKMVQLRPIELWTRTGGQDLIEYALLAGFIVLAAVSVFPPIGASVSTIFSKVEHKANCAAIMPTYTGC